MGKSQIDILTHAIIGSAMEVHRTLGCGFQEHIYQKALALEMTFRGLAFEREMEMHIHYKGDLIGKRRVDFFVEGCVMVELKAIEKITGLEKVQAINYLEADGVADGLLINFGGLSLQFIWLYNKALVTPE